MSKAITVDAYLERAVAWNEELVVLREVVRACDLEETTKWGIPCYTHDGRNVVGIAAFKSYVGLWFFDGVHLSDPDGVLVNAQEGKTKSMRQWRFTSMKAIKRTRVKAYVKEAIAVAQRLAEERRAAPGRTVARRSARTAKPLRLPLALAAALDRSARARAAFDALTPGRQREYAAYIADAKQDATKIRRVQKIMPMIRAGHGLNDRYR